MKRPVFALRVCAEPGVNIIHALRHWLKRGLRDFGLRCVSIEQLTEESEMADMRQYTSGIITADDLRDGPREERIISVFVSEKHQVPVLELESGGQLYAWPPNGRTLARAYGHDSDDWRGHMIKLELGEPYTDKNGVRKDTVKLTPISSRDGNAANGSPQRVDPAKLPAPVKKHTAEDDMEDSIPFN
jgi:hypothetical protein